MLRVYNWMGSGLLLTGIVAYLIANTSAIDLFYRQVQTPSGTGYSATPHPSPHFPPAIAGMNTPAFDTAWANVSISGSRRCSGMLGMSS